MSDLNNETLISQDTLCLCRLMDDNDSILWQGKPQWNGFKKFKPISFISILFGYVLCFLFEYWLMSVFWLLQIQLDSVEAIAFISIIVILVNFLFFSLGFEFYLEFKTLENTEYFITQTKVIEIQNSRNLNKIFCININEITEFSRKTSKKNHSTITIYSSHVDKFDRLSGKWSGSQLKKSFITFRFISEPDLVMNLLKKVGAN